MYHLVLFILINVFSINLLNGQNLDWVLMPSITDADEIFLSSHEPKLVVIRKRYKYGVKDIENKLILDTEFSGLLLSIDQQVIYEYYRGSMRGLKMFFSDGRIISDQKYNERKKHPRELLYQRSNKLLYDYAYQYDLKLDSFLFDSNKYFSLLNDKEEVLIDSIAYAKKIFQEGLIAVVQNKDIGVYDSVGDIFFKGELSKYSDRIISNGNRLYHINNTIFDENWNVLISSSRYKAFDLVQDYDLYIHCNSKCQLFNLENEIEVPRQYSKISQIDDHWLSLENYDGPCDIFSLEKRELILENQERIGIPINGLVVTFLSVDGISKAGVYNYYSEKFILENQYLNTEIFTKVIVASNSNYGIQNREFSFFDLEGNKLFDISGLSVIETSPNAFYIRKEDGKNVIVDIEGNNLLSEDYCTVLKNFDDYWVYTQDVREKKLYYRVADLVEGINEGYDSVEVYKNSNYEGKPMYIFSKNGKYGLYHFGNGVVIEPQFDKLHFNKKEMFSEKNHSDLIIALQDGMWGAFKNPVLIK